MNINEIQDEIIEEFSVFDDWMDKYSLIIDMGNALEPMAEEDKNPENIIEGCQSRVWITARMEDGKVRFSGESNDTGYRPLLHQGNWFARTSIAYSF